MEFKKPKIFVIGETKIEIGDEQAYLEHIGAPDWYSGECSNIEELSEVYSRSCYKSFGVGLNPNITKVREGNDTHLKNVIESGHGSVLEHCMMNFMFCDVSRVFCYDDKTEVLTNDGWKLFKDLIGSERIGTLNPNTNELEYQEIEEYFEKEVNIKMYKVQSEQIDLLVTGNHRMWVQKYDVRKDKVFKIWEPKDIWNRRVKYQKTAIWKGKNKDEFFEIGSVIREYDRRDTGTHTIKRYDGCKFPMLDFVRFLGYYITEGSITKTGKIYISQNPGVVTDKIVRCIKNLGLVPYTYNGYEAITENNEDVKVGTSFVRTQSASLYDYVVKLGNVAHEKVIPQFLHDLSPKLIREFINCVVEGDGNKRKDCNHRVIYTTSKKFADDLQILAIKAGFSANIRMDNRVGNTRTMKSGQIFKHKHICYIVSLVEKRTYPLVNHNRKGLEFHDSIVDYKGKVYCVKVSNGLLFVRRNGKPVVSGNTHELVRHRVGVAISQESLRYVRLTELKSFDFPRLEEELTEKEEEWFRHKVEEVYSYLESVQKEMTEKFNLNDEKSFAKKKKLTSRMRRLAPLGLLTNIGWSANLRTLRHVIPLRTHKSAEEEIRYVFAEIGSICKKRFPNIFFDMEWVSDENNTGLGEWRIANRKV